jgi:Domain of unknown function (DUF4157)
MEHQHEPEAKTPGARHKREAIRYIPLAEHVHLSVLQLQQSIGNRAVQRLLVNRATRSSNTSAPRMLQAQVADSTGPAGQEREEKEFIPKQSLGQSLDKQTREFMESRFRADFGQVQVHTDTSAAESAEAMNAVAYTAGRDIYFAQGKYSPQTREGQHLIAHELTHTIQQREEGTTPNEVA